MASALSRLANKKANRTTMLERVFDVVRNSRRGATADEVEIALNENRSSVSNRMSDLKKAGLIVSAGTNRLTRSGRPAEVFVIA
jgi:predicted transcriptional regulator